MFLTVSLALIGAALVSLSVATTIPVLGLLGAAYLIGAWLSRPRGDGARRPLVRSIFGFLVLAVGAMVVAAFGFVSLRARPADPDAFYTFTSTAPTQPGTLLRAEPFTRVVPTNARVWRILYTTTRADNVPAIASAIVLAPSPSTSDARPVVAWTHGTTGVEPGCAPSVLPPPFPFDATVPALERLIAEKWVLVGTDYVGLGTGGGHPYLIGEPEGRSALDAVRATKHLPDLKIDPRTVVWGHSQGGHAAMWTGIVAPRYAPDVSISGIAALAPATEVGALVEAAQHTPVGKIMSAFVMTAYSQTYSDVSFDEYVGPVARARAMASRCLSGPGALVSVLTALTMERDFFVSAPAQGRLGERFKENVPTGSITAPLLIAQGLSDDLVLPAVQERFVRERCAAGQNLEYRTYPGRDHVSVVAPDSPLTEDLVRWTRDRFSGAPTEGGCRTVAR